MNNVINFFEYKRKLQARKENPYYLNELFEVEAWA